MTTSTCIHCGAETPGKAKFCVQCGKPVGGPSQCPKCNATVPANSRFCVSCGDSLLGDVKSDVQDGNRWIRRPGDFACKLETKDLKALLGKGVAISEGTRGLLFQHGKLVGMLDPGFHTVQTVTERLKALVFGSPCSVVLVDVGDADLSMVVPSLRTGDNQEVAASLSVVAGLEVPLDFYINVMRDQDRITTVELSNRISQQVTSVMQAVISGCNTEELYGNRELAERIEEDLRSSLARSFNRWGLVFHHVDFVGFEGDAYDEVRRARGELKRDEAVLDVSAQRIQLKKKFRELFNENAMNKIDSKQDFDEFLKNVEHEAGVKDLLRQQERDELWRQYEEKKEDHRSAREHLLALLEWQRKLERVTEEKEYKLTLLRGRHELDDEQRQHQIQALEQEQKAEIERLNRQHEVELQRLEKNRTSDLAHEAATANEKLRQLEKKGRIGVDLQKQWEDVKHEKSQREIDRNLHRQRGEQEIHQTDKDADHRRELERLDSLASMSVEALIATAPGDRAKMLAELQQTEALKGLSEEQILARAAENSPEVARAFAEKFRAAGGQQAHEQMETMYERMIEEKDKSGKQFADAQQESVRLLRDLMDTALKTQRDTSVAAAQGQPIQGPAVIYPPPGSGAATVVGSQQPAQQSPGELDCPQCHSRSPLGSQFCGNCGFRFS